MRTDKEMDFSDTSVICPKCDTQIDFVFNEARVSDAVEFLKWVEDNGWIYVTSEELDKSMYVDNNEHTVYANGSDTHFTNLIKKYGKTEEELYKLFLETKAR